MNQESGVRSQDEIDKIMLTFFMMGKFSGS